jgi:hypothetical protein
MSDALSLAMTLPILTPQSELLSRHECRAFYGGNSIPKLATKHSSPVSVEWDGLWARTRLACEHTQALHADRVASPFYYRHWLLYGSHDPQKNTFCDVITKMFFCRSWPAKKHILWRHHQNVFLPVMTRKKIHSVTSSPKCIFAGHDPQKNTFCDVITKIIQDITD